MPYKVQFVGLVCFYREWNSRQALLPDGRNPVNGIDPHFPFIVVASDAVESADWEGEALGTALKFELPPCSLVIEGVDVPGALDTSAHDGLLPQLRQLNPDFEIDPDQAETVARLYIRQGTLSAYKVPGGEPGREALISQLDVPHDGSITITVMPTDGSTARMLRLSAGTEIAITNMARAGLYDELTAQQDNGHFRIYEKLSVRPVTLTTPPPNPPVGVAQSPSHHPMFMRNEAINLNTSCSNTGCC